MIKLSIDNGKVECPISKVQMPVNDCKRCTYCIKLTSKELECNFK
jgi:hypothetical protein